MTMKWLIVLALAAACSTKKPEVATESDSKPVAASEVKSCICNKIFMPVCAGGVSYPNSCEAECYGHKKWTDGQCPEPKKKK